MIISHKHKFIFIKTKKTAGSSLELYLHPFCGVHDVVTPFNTTFDNEEKDGLSQNTAISLTILEKIKLALTAKGRIFLNRFKRNNWQYYEHMSAEEVKFLVGQKIWNEYHKFCIVRNPYDRIISHYFFRNKRHNLDHSFDEYLQNKKFSRNLPVYTDWTSGEILVDSIILYENLGQDLSKVFNKLNIRSIKIIIG